MGIFRRLIGLADEPKTLPPLVPVIQREEGVSGSSNYAGTIFAENNTKLQHAAAYGQNWTWGEYERIIRTDPAVGTALEMTAAPLRDARLEVEPGGEDDRSIQIGDFLRDNLQEWLDPTWGAFVDQTVKGKLGYGYSLHEKVYGFRSDARAPGGKALFLAKLAERLPSSVKTNGWIERDGDLAEIHQEGTRDGAWVSDIILPADRVLLVTWQRNGNNYQGYSHLRDLWYICKIREVLLKVTGLGAQRESSGIPIASVDKDAKITDTQREQLQTFLESMVFHENAAAVMFPGVSIDWIYSPAANKGHVVDTYNALGTVIHQKFFAQQLALGTNGEGSRAVGGTHADSQKAFITGVGSNLEAHLNGVGSRKYTGIVRDIVDANFGPQARYPKVKLVLKRPEVAISVKATAAKTLSEAGLLTPTIDDENALREELGLAPIDAEVRDAEIARKTEAARMAAQAMKPVEDEEQEEKLSSAAAFMPRRKLRPEEETLSLAEMDRYLTDAREDFRRAATPLLIDMVRAQLPAIREAMKDGDPSEVATLKFDTKRLTAQVRHFIEATAAEGYRQAKNEKRRATGVRLAAEEEEEDDKRPGEEVEAEPEREPVIRAQTSLVVDRMVARVRALVQEEALEVVARGEDAGNVAENVAAELSESKATRTDAGLVLTRAFTMGRQEFFEENAEAIEAMVYSAILDDPSTCGPCLRADGEEVEYGSAEYDRLLPPNRECEGGSNCRCIFAAKYRGGPGFQRV